MLDPLQDAWATLRTVCGETEASLVDDYLSQRHPAPARPLLITCMDRKYRSSSWVDARIEIREAPGRGNGSFALAPIGAGEIVTIWGGQVFTLAEIQAGKARKKSLVAIGEDLYLGEEVSHEPYQPGSDHYLNHSRDPNVWMVDEVTLAARRDIAKDEELTADYAFGGCAISASDIAGTFRRSSMIESHA